MSRAWLLGAVCLLTFSAAFTVLMALDAPGAPAAKAECVQVGFFGKPCPTLTVFSDPPGSHGSAITLYATVGKVPCSGNCMSWVKSPCFVSPCAIDQGTVFFSVDDGPVIGSAPLVDPAGVGLPAGYSAPDGGGVARFQTRLPAGTHAIYATYRHPPNVDAGYAVDNDNGLHPYIVTVPAADTIAAIDGFEQIDDDPTRGTYFRVSASVQRFPPVTGWAPTTGTIRVLACVVTCSPPRGSLEAECTIYLDPLSPFQSDEHCYLGQGFTAQQLLSPGLKSLAAIYMPPNTPNSQFNRSEESQHVQLVVPDYTPPVLTAAFLGSPGNIGPGGIQYWRSPVRVTWTATDPDSPASVGYEPNCNPDLPAASGQSVTAEGATTVTCTAHSTGGTTTQTVQVTIDATPPTIVGVVTSSPNSAGWYDHDVTIRYTCSDAGSGIAAGACPADQVLSAEGDAVANVSTPCDSGCSFVGPTVQDQAGNTGTPNLITVKIDKTRPSSAPFAAPSPNPYGWHNTPVVVTWNWTDRGSGIVTDQCAPSSTAAAEGSNIVVGKCADLAGNEAISTSAPMWIDTIAPRVAPSVSPDPVAFGGVATVTANASDLGSLIASSSCDPVDTSVPGVQSVSCTATDRAGNSTTASAAYLVSTPLRAGKTTCDGVFSGSGTDVVVPKGATCILLPGTVVARDVRVGKSAWLITDGAEIGRSVKANQPEGIQLDGGSVGRDVSIKGATGSGVVVEGVDVGRDLLVKNNRAPVVVAANSVGRDLEVTGNRAGGVIVSANNAGHKAKCKANTPQTGDSNTAVAANSCPA